MSRIAQSWTSAVNKKRKLVRSIILFRYGGNNYFQTLNSYAKEVGFDGGNSYAKTRKTNFFKTELEKVPLKDRIRVLGTNCVRSLGNMFSDEAKQGTIDLQLDPRVCLATQKKSAVSVDVIYRTTVLAAINHRYNTQMITMMQVPEDNCLNQN